MTKEYRQQSEFHASMDRALRLKEGRFESARAV
jgi:hypothetical protein